MAHGGQKQRDSEAGGDHGADQVSGPQAEAELALVGVGAGDDPVDQAHLGRGEAGWTSGRGCGLQGGLASNVVGGDPCENTVDRLRPRVVASSSTLAPFSI